MQRETRKYKQLSKRINNVDTEMKIHEKPRRDKHKTSSKEIKDKINT